MGFIYLTLILLFIILYILTKKYKKEKIKCLDKKEHKLKSFYGMSMCILDFLKKNKIFKEKKERSNRFRELYVLDNSKEIEYLYKIKMISACILVIVFFSSIGLIMSVSELLNNNNSINLLQRAAAGEGDTDYEIQYEEDDDSEVIDITVEEQALTDDEIYEMYDEIYESVVQKMLNENESQEEVRTNLDFISSYDLVEIIWDVEDKNIINYNGEIVADFSEETEIITYVTAEFTYDEIVVIYEIPIIVLEPEYSVKDKIQIFVQNYINNENSIFDEEVILPDSVDGEEIEFSFIQEKEAKYYIFICITAVIMIVLLYEKNINKQLKERKEQMISDYPDIVSKLALLNEAGLNLLSAWQRIIIDGEKNSSAERYVYQEMKFTYGRIKNGEAEAAEYAKFGKRCKIHQYIKLGNLLEQNLLKGSRGLSMVLQQEAREAFEERKRNARKKGEEAGTKLLLPMMIMLVIVIIIIVIPAFISMDL